MAKLTLRAFAPLVASWMGVARTRAFAIAALLTVFACIPAMIFACTPLSHDWPSLGPVWLALVALGIAGRAVSSALSRPIGAALLAWAVFFALSLLGSLTGTLLAVSAQPLVDPLLASADTVFGFDWPVFFAAWRDQDLVLKVLSFAYSTLAWQPVLLLGLLAMRTRAAEMRRFLLAWGLALLGTLTVFPFAPAYGNFLVHGIVLSDQPAILVHSAWNFAGTFDSLRSGAATVITRDMLDGLVTFPSFHTSGAVILAAYWGAIPRLRSVFVVLNALMIVSAVLIGGHYLVDVLAGIAIALGTIWLVSPSPAPTAATVSPRPGSLREPAPARVLRPTYEAASR